MTLARVAEASELKMELSRLAGHLVNSISQKDKGFKEYHNNLIN